MISTLSVDFGTTWVSSGGGPLILMPEGAMPHWEGTDIPSAERSVTASFRYDPSGASATDYDQACDIKDDIGLISVGESWGLVLNASPDDTTWHSWTEAEGCLIRLGYLDEDIDFAEHLEIIRSREGKQEGMVLSVSSEPLYLFDAAFNGNFVLQTQQFIRFSLPAGQYAVYSDIYEEEDMASLRIH